MHAWRATRRDECVLTFRAVQTPVKMQSGDRKIVGLFTSGVGRPARVASRCVNVGDNFSTTGHHTGADRCPLQGAITVSRYNSIYVNFCCIPHPIYGVCRTILCAKPSEQVYTRRLFCRGSRCRNSNPFRIGVNSMD